MYIAKYFSLSLKILKSRVWGAQDKINQVFFVFFLLFVCEFVNSFIFFISFSWKKKYPFFISIICFLFFFFFSVNHSHFHNSFTIFFLICTISFYQLPQKRLFHPLQEILILGERFVEGVSEYQSTFFFFFFQLPKRHIYFFPFIYFYFKLYYFNHFII